MSSGLCAAPQRLVGVDRAHDQRASFGRRAPQPQHAAAGVDLRALAPGLRQQRGVQRFLGADVAAGHAVAAQGAGRHVGIGRILGHLHGDRGRAEFHGAGIPGPRQLVQRLRSWAGLPAGTRGCPCSCRAGAQPRLHLFHEGVRQVRAQRLRRLAQSGRRGFSITPALIRRPAAQPVADQRAHVGAHAHVQQASSGPKVLLFSPRCTRTCGGSSCRLEANMPGRIPCRVPARTRAAAAARRLPPPAAPRVRPRPWRRRSRCRRSGRRSACRPSRRAGRRSRGQPAQAGGREVGVRTRRIHGAPLVVQDAPQFGLQRGQAHRLVQQRDPGAIGFLQPVGRGVAADQDRGGVRPIAAMMLEMAWMPVSPLRRRMSASTTSGRADSACCVASSIDASTNWQPVPPAARACPCAPSARRRSPAR